MIKKLLIIMVVAETICFAQDYVSLYNKQNYTDSIKFIEKELDDFYKDRVREKRVPSGYTSIEKIGEKEDLLKLYRNRKVKSFFIEKNQKVAQLHYYLGMNYFQIKQYSKALGQFTQSLRFRENENEKDDIVFYQISQVFKNLYSNDRDEYFKAYLNSLEQAYSLNKNKLSYSLELGLALYTTKFKKKSIFHIERYVNESGDNIDPKLYIKLASLNESIYRYLETEKNYARYLKKKPDDETIHFALGYIAYYRTGNYSLARRSFTEVLSRIDKKNIDIRCKCFEYIGDMDLSDLRFDSAEKNYMQSLVLQRNKFVELTNIEKKISQKNEEIDRLKKKLIYDRNFLQFEEYEMLLDDKGSLETSLRKVKDEYGRLNSGKINWNLALINVKKEKLKRAIAFYRESIRYNYKADLAREKIVKLQLKIKRGY